MPKRIKLRLYRERDMDLICLCLNDGDAFKTHLQNALNAVASGKDYKIPVPPVGFANSYQGYLRPVTAIQLMISDSAMEFLSKAKPRMMRQLILTVLRNCMERLPYENCLKGDGIDFNRMNTEFNEMFPEADSKPAAPQNPKPRKEAKAPAVKKPVIQPEEISAADITPATPQWTLQAEPEQPPEQQDEELEDAFNALSALAHLSV